MGRRSAWIHHNTEDTRHGQTAVVAIEGQGDEKGSL